MQEVIMPAITYEEVLRCPICGTSHPTKEAAEECLDMGLWNRDFDVERPLWCWNIFRPISYKHIELCG